MNSSVAGGLVHHIIDENLAVLHTFCIVPLATMRGDLARLLRRHAWSANPCEDIGRVLRVGHI